MRLGSSSVLPAARGHQPHSWLLFRAWPLPCVLRPKHPTPQNTAIRGEGSALHSNAPRRDQSPPAEVTQKTCRKQVPGRMPPCQFRRAGLKSGRTSPASPYVTLPSEQQENETSPKPDTPLTNHLPGVVLSRCLDARKWGVFPQSGGSRHVSGYQLGVVCLREAEPTSGETHGVCTAAGFPGLAS